MKYFWKGKNVAILGWGINGLDAAKYLLKKNSIITILDQKSEKELNITGIDIRRIKTILGKNYLKNGLDNFDYVFRSPGVYRYLPEIVKAEKRGVKITSVVNLFFDLCGAKIIGVTGTKGKGTTSTLIYKILKKSGKDVYLSGNIGAPMLELLPKVGTNSWVVLELSSFQLIDTTKSPYIAVVLNITEDHMDWHKNRNEYVRAKAKIVTNQKKNNYAVLAYDYKDSMNFSKLTKGIVYYFSKFQRIEGSYIESGKIILRIDNKEHEIGETKNLLLRGEHNWENVCAAVCASYLAGASIQDIKSVIFSFKGLEHRLELVGSINGVKFYNDSFSTNPQTTIAAIKSFSEPLTLILGGYDKGLKYDEMASVISQSNVVNVILIGDISQKLKKLLKKVKYKNNLMELGYSKMRKILRTSAKVTDKGGVVLLSPAAASFDMFVDYKDRGNQFKKEFKNLKLYWSINQLA